MNKTSKIFLAIIVVLTLALGILTFEYINLRNSAKSTLADTLENAQELQNAYKRIQELENKINTIKNTVNE